MLAQTFHRPRGAGPSPASRRAGGARGGGDDNGDDEGKCDDDEESTDDDDEKSDDDESDDNGDDEKTGGPAGPARAGREPEDIFVLVRLRCLLFRPRISLATDSFSSLDGLIGFWVS